MPVLLVIVPVTVTLPVRAEVPETLTDAAVSAPEKVAATPNSEPERVVVPETIAEPDDI